MVANIFAALPGRLPAELFTTLLNTPTVRIERIISQGHITPEGTWYDQAWDEWVLLLQGCAHLQIEPLEPYILQPGDYCFIPAYARHRVTYTEPHEQTIWLAVHLHV